MWFVLGVVVLVLVSSNTYAEEGQTCDVDGKNCSTPADGQTLAPTGDRKSVKSSKKVSSQGTRRTATESAVLNPVKGSDHATITIIEYEDLRCPPCAMTSHVLDEVMTAYPDQIRIMFKHFPLPVTTEALLAHEAAMAAGEQGKFWEMRDRIWAHKGAITENDLKVFAGELKLNSKKFFAAIRDHRYQPTILRDVSEGKGFGVAGAPTFFINGRKLVGMRSAEDFKRVIDKELGQSKTAQSPPLTSAFATSALAEVPGVTAAAINTDGAPVRGSPDAQVTIVEFSDFQCPYCAKSVANLKEVLTRYPTQVRWVFKHFPLPFHQDAPLAHRASLAAGEQGKFWEMHDLIFERQTKIKRDNLIQYAKDLGLDEKRFLKDLDSKKYQARIDREVQEGTRSGVTGTPAFFVNGRLLVGARPVEELARLIDSDLQAPLISSLPPAVSPQAAQSTDALSTGAQ